MATAAKTAATRARRLQLKPDVRFRDQCMSQTKVKAVAPVRAAPVTLIVATWNSLDGWAGAK